MNATPTDQAVGLMSSQKFSVIISDFKRADDTQAGYTLLREVQAQPKPVPLIIFSASATPDFEKDAKRLGAMAETNSQQFLFDAVIYAIRK